MINSQVTLVTKHIKYLKEKLGQFLQPLCLEKQTNAEAGGKTA